jgi:DNA-binding CsgD family transcriptional regulator
MRLSQDISGFTDQMVADCALGSASIFFYDDNAGKGAAQGQLSYLYHVGVSEEAQHRYQDGRVFKSDPFTRQLLAQSGVSGAHFVHWGDAVLDRFVARNYTSFLDHYAVDVVGASTRTLAPGLCLIIGAHRHGRDGGRRTPAVPEALLQQRLHSLSNMVVDRFLADLIDSADGRVALRTTLGSAPPGVTGLSPREEQLAALLCRGLQNKAIAFEMDLSENTVENYLRRLYAKLGVRNRAGLVYRMTQRLH